MAGFDLSKLKAKLDSIPEGFSEKVAQVGWFETAKYPDEKATPVAYVAAIQEYGAPEVGIPARPTVRPTIDAKKDAWAKLMGDGVKAIIDGKAAATDVLESVGMQAAGDIRATIASVSAPALSPTTVMLRKWKRADPSLKVTGKTVGAAAAAVEAGESTSGVNADPLRDTNLLVNSVNHAVGEAP
jgi:hypothetical protein